MSTATRPLLEDRATRLFVALAAFFCANALLAEFIGVKIFALEDTFGQRPWEWNLFGQSGSLSFTAGTLLWPIVFIMTVYHRIRRRTGNRHAWLRATGSTAVSQLVDSFVVLYIAFVLGPQHWGWSLFLAVATLNYAYKMLAAIALIPLLYLARAGIHRYLGRERADALRVQAALA